MIPRWYKALLIWSGPFGACYQLTDDVVGGLVLSAIWPAIYLVGSCGYALHKRLGEGGYVPEEADLRSADLRQVEGLTWQQIRSV